MTGKVSGSPGTGLEPMTDPRLTGLILDLSSSPSAEGPPISLVSYNITNIIPLLVYSIAEFDFSLAMLPLAGGFC